MKSLAGFPNYQGNHFLSRSAIVPSEELQMLVFPNIEYWMTKFNNNDCVQEDIAGPNFLRLLKQLRIVFLQDSVLLKSKYPDYYLWTCQIFQTDLYRRFEEELLPVARKQESVFNASNLVQVAMPELVTSIQNGFDKLSAALTTMQASQSSQANQLQKSLADFFAFGNMYFNANNSNSFSAPPSIPNNGNEPTSQADNTDISIEYKLNRRIISITDLWREYDEGLSGSPSVKELELKYGTAWRKERNESCFYSRRKEVYDYILKKAERMHTAPIEIAKGLEERRINLSISIDKFRKILKEE